jgi:hypothetical protein
MLPPAESMNTLSGRRFVVDNRTTAIKALACHAMNGCVRRTGAMRCRSGPLYYINFGVAISEDGAKTPFPLLFNF